MKLRLYDHYPKRTCICVTPVRYYTLVIPLVRFGDWVRGSPLVASLCVSYRPASGLRTELAQVIRQEGPDAPRRR